MFTKHPTMIESELNREALYLAGLVEHEKTNGT